MDSKPAYFTENEAEGKTDDTRPGSYKYDTQGLHLKLLKSACKYQTSIFVEESNCKASPNARYTEGLKESYRVIDRMLFQKLVSEGN